MSKSSCLKNSSCALGCLFLIGLSSLLMIHNHYTLKIEAQIQNVSVLKEYFCLYLVLSTQPGASTQTLPVRSFTRISPFTPYPKKYNRFKHRMVNSFPRSRTSAKISNIISSINQWPLHKATLEDLTISTLGIW